MASEDKDSLKQMSRMDALWTGSPGCTIDQAKKIIGMKYNHESARHWAVWMIGESGIGKNHLLEQLCKEKDIDYLWFPCKGIAPEDIRGFPMPVRKLNGTTKDGGYSGDIKGLVDLMSDYYQKEPVYKFQQLEYLLKAFNPGWKGIIHFDEFPQASKEVQEILYMFFYDRRLDDKELSDGAMIIASMNPPQVNEYLLAKISKAAQDRPSLIKIEPSVREWIKWATKSNIHATVVDFVSEHTSVYTKNKGRCLHRLSDDLKCFGDIDPNNLPAELKIVVHGDIDPDSANMFARHLKNVFEISGVSLLLGDKKQWGKLKKMLKSESKTVHLYRVQQEMLRAFEAPETLLASLWKQHKDPGDAWSEVSERVIKYLKLMQAGDMDSAIGLLKEVTRLSITELEDRVNLVLKHKDNRELRTEVLRCLSVDIKSKSSMDEDPLENQESQMMSVES